VWDLRSGRPLGEALVPEQVNGLNFSSMAPLL